MSECATIILAGLELNYVCKLRTPIHITVSPLLFKILEICKLHEIPYEKLNGVNLLNSYDYLQV